MHKIKEMGLWREELSSLHTKIHTKRRWLFSEKLNVLGCVGMVLCVNTFLALFSYRAFSLSTHNIQHNQTDWLQHTFINFKSPK